MKKVLALLIVFVFVASMAAPMAFAGEYKPFVKLYDGVKQVLMSPKQIPDHTASEIEASDVKPVGFIGGLIKGTAHTAKEILHGAFTMVTFPFPDK